MQEECRIEILEEIQSPSLSTVETLKNHTPKNVNDATTTKKKKKKINQTKNHHSKTETEDNNRQPTVFPDPTENIEDFSKFYLEDPKIIEMLKESQARKKEFLHDKLSKRIKNLRAKQRGTTIRENMTPEPVSTPKPLPTLNDPIFQMKLKHFMAALNDNPAAREKFKKDSGIPPDYCEDLFRIAQRPLPLPPRPGSQETSFVPLQKKPFPEYQPLQTINSLGSEEDSQTT